MTEVPTIAADAAERVVAGCVLRGPEEVDDARAAVHADDFGNWPCRLVFEAAGRLRDAGRRVDAASVLIDLTAAGKAIDLGPNPAVFLAELLETAPTSAGLSYAATKVREAAARRELMRVGAELMRDAGDPSETPDEIAARFEARLTTAADGRGQADEPVALSAAMAAAVGRYEDAAAGRRKNPAPPTGFAGLDRLIGGLAPGGLYVLAARPSVGKSALALRLAEESARRGNGVLIFSLEMGTGENTDRMVASAARVQLPRLRGDSPMAPDQCDRVADLYQPGGFQDLPVWLDDRPARTAAGIAAVARRWVRRKGVKVIVVDYLGLIRPENPRDPRHLQVGLASKRMKELARGANVAVVLLSQLNREIEARGGNGKPKLSDLRDSGEVEQDADCVVLMHRLDDDERAAVHPVDLIVAKNRNGPTGTVALDYHRPFTRFEERTPVGV